MGGAGGELMAMVEMMMLPMIMSSALNADDIDDVGAIRVDHAGDD